MVGLCVRCLALAFAAQGEPGAIVDSTAAASAPRFTEAIAVVGSVDDDAVERARGFTLGRDALEALPVETLAETLAELPGVVVLFAHPFGGVPMVLARGFFGGGEVDYVGLEIDGVPRAELESGVADWGALRAVDVGRIDYLPGASLARGGVDPALAGAVRIAPVERGADERLLATASVASFATRSLTVAWSDAAPQGLALSADAGATGGYREHAAAEGLGLELRYRRPGAGGDWTVAGYARRRDREEPGPLSESELAGDPLASNPLFADDRERVDRGGLALRYARRAGAFPLEARLEVDGREARFQRTLLLAEGYGDSALRELETSAVRFGVGTPGEIALGERFALRLAVDGRREEVETAYSNPASGQQLAFARARRERAVAEAGLTFRPHARLELVGSLRGDRIDEVAGGRGNDRDALSPRLGLVWALAGDEGAGVTLVAEAGRAFKAPTLDQLYDPRPITTPDGSLTISNPELEPQESRGLEIGLAARRGGMNVRLVGYRSILENEIDFDPATFRYGNIGRSRHEGIELSGGLDLDRFGSLRAWWAHATARAEGAAPSGQLKNLPRDVARLGWRVRLPFALELDLAQSFLAGRFADDANQHALDDAFRTDLRLSRRFGSEDRLRLALDLLNLADDDALELAYLLPGATGGESLHGYAPAPRAVRLVVERAW